MELKREIDFSKAVESHQVVYTELIKGVKCSVSNEDIELASWIKQVVTLLDSVKTKNRRLFFIGNGASCSMASHFASDFTKNGGVPSFSCNEGALLTCFGNDFSFETAYMEILKRHMNDGDVLIAISSSGSSKNIVNAVKYVKDELSESRVVTFSGFKESNPLRASGDYNLFLNISDYGHVESGHAYYLHMLIDFLIMKGND